ncbi:MAG: discoidin domain-containing protein, partial [Victivallaceae bacterium]|nr:discoidin domain-containing protein [Victivallaceae bacterium]
LIKNNSSFSRKVDITARLNVEGKETSAILRGIKFNQGAQHQDITIPLHVTGEGTLAVALQDTESGQVVRSQWFSVAVDYIPLKVDVLRPHYQNAIFSGQKVKDIELEVITAMAPEERQNYIFEFVLSSDKEILRNQTKIEGEKTIVSAPLPSLEIGDYRMQGRLIHRPTGKVIAKWQDVLRKLAPRKGEVRFDENMVCLIDNKPFLPFGINNQGSLQDAIEIGCNAIENFWIFRRGWKDKDIDKYFNKLHQAGLKLVVYPYPRGFPVPQAGKNNLSKPITPKQEEMLRSHLRKIRHYPEILAWYSANEPQPLGGWGPHIVSQKTMKQIDEIIKEEDPYHPTAIALRNISYYADTTAVLWPDPYPGFIKNGGWIHRHCPTKSVRQAIKVTKGRKPVWVILQAHDGALFGRQNDRAPNFVELRNQMHQAAVAGAKGFFWYCRYWIEPQVKMGLTYLAKECQLLREAIFAPESSQEFIAVKGVSKYPDLHLSRREVGEDTYLFAVSSANKKREIRFNVAGLKDRQLFVVGENHEVKLQRGEFTDSFEPYDTHIYTTNKSLARQLNMAGVCREIADISAKVIKPGNIAHKSNGTVVKFSKTTNHRYPSIDSVIDGIKATSYWGGGNWVEVTFAKPEKISKLVIDSNTSQLDIEAKKDGAWIKVAEVKTDKKASRRKIHTVKFPLIETRKLRLKGFSPLKIWEIEAYGK